MDREQKQLLALVRLAIHPYEHVPSLLIDNSVDWNKIFVEAKKQSLVGVAFVGFKIWLASEIGNRNSSQIDKVLMLFE